MPRPLQPPGTLWTIGHSTHTLEEFVALLWEHEVACVADVRHFPGSRRVPWFNAESLGRSLRRAGIEYVSMRGLGGRRPAHRDSPHTAWRNAAFRGYADFMDTPEFARAAGELAELARSTRVAIMCAEGVWWRCHRSMIADYFKANGWTVLHIMGAGPPTEHPYTPVARIEDGRLVY
jgi:uncharacterized protein (DUF488 family)